MQGGSGSSIAKSVAAVVVSRELFLMPNNINCEAMQYPLPSRDSSKCTLQVNKNGVSKELPGRGGGEFMKLLIEGT